MNEPYSQEIANAILDFLTDDNWDFDFNETTGSIRFGIKLNGKIRNAQIVINIYENAYNVFGLIPISAEASDHKMMTMMAEFLHRANNGLKNGNFELDFNNGEIRYKIHTDCEGFGAPTTKMIHNSILCNAVILQRYSEGIVRIILSYMNAKTAIDICESSRQHRSAIEENDNIEVVDDEATPASYVEFNDSEITYDEDDVFETDSFEDHPADPNSNTFCDEETSDLIQMLKEMYEDDET